MMDAVLLEPRPAVHGQNTIVVTAEVHNIHPNHYSDLNSSKDLDSDEFEQEHDLMVPLARDQNNNYIHLNSSPSIVSSVSSHESREDKTVVNINGWGQSNGFVENEQTFDQKDDISLNEVLGRLDSVIVGAENGLNSDNYSQAASSLMSSSLVSLLTESDITSVPSDPLFSSYSSSASESRDRSKSSATRKAEFIRRVERFGNDLKDTCLFPLALPMDGSDIYKGCSTWESIHLLADCVLTLWTREHDETRSLAPKPEPNAILSNSTRYLCFQPDLADQLLLCPELKLPLRKHSSELELSLIGKGQLDKSAEAQFVPLKKKLCWNQAKLVNTQKEKVHDDEVDGEEESSHGILRRTRSQSSLAASSNTIVDSKHRKDMFNLDFSKNMKTEARHLASKHELENPSKFARKLSKFEKQYYLNISSRELMSVLFRRVSCNCKNLRNMLEFGQEMSQLIANIILSEFTTEGQGQLIANAIETAFILHQKQNYQSFESMMRGLHLPQIYLLIDAWRVVKNKNPLHLRVFTYLSTLISCRATNSTSYPLTPCSLPSLNSLVAVLRLKSISLCEHLDSKCQWREGPRIVNWLTQYDFDDHLIEDKIEEKRLLEVRGKLKRWQKSHQKMSMEKVVVEPRRHSLAALLGRKEKNRIGRDSISSLRCTLRKCFEEGSQPTSWMLYSSRNLPSQHQIAVIKQFQSIYDEIFSCIQSFKF